MIVFGCLPQDFGRCQVPMKGNLSFYVCRLSGGDTQRCYSNHTCCNEICFELFALTGGGDTETTSNFFGSDDLSKQVN